MQLKGLEVDNGMEIHKSKHSTTKLVGRSGILDDSTLRNGNDERSQCARKCSFFGLQGGI